MRQVLFEVPGIGLKIFGYGMMLFLSFLVSMNLAARLAKREKLDKETIYDVALWIFAGGLIGARLFYVCQYWGTRVHHFSEIFRIWEGGIVLYGSGIGAAVGFLLYRLLRPFPVRPIMDTIAPAVALGIAIGRVGCFLNGCCFGDRCEMPWGVRFPGPRPGQPGSPPWADQVRSGAIAETASWSLPVHPTQLYSALDGLILMVLLLAYFPLRKRDGEVMALLLVTYPVSRFLIEWLRNDEGAFLGGLTISQNISLGLFAVGLAFWAWLRTRKEVLYVNDVARQEAEIAE